MFRTVSFSDFWMKPRNRRQGIWGAGGGSQLQHEALAPQSGMETGPGTGSAESRPLDASGVPGAGPCASQPLSPRLSAPGSGHGHPPAASPAWASRRRGGPRGPVRSVASPLRPAGRSPHRGLGDGAPRAPSRAGALSDIAVRAILPKR